MTGMAETDVDDTARWIGNGYIVKDSTLNGNIVKPHNKRVAIMYSKKLN